MYASIIKRTFLMREFGRNYIIAEYWTKGLFQSIKISVYAVLS